MKGIELHRHKDHIILVTAIEFRFLKEIVKFTQRETSNWHETEDSEDDEDLKTKFYQRETNSERVKNIKKYIYDSLFNQTKTDEVLFPSSMILSIDSNNNEFEKREDNVLIFDLPKEKESSLIVDGQHRMKAMMMLNTELNNRLDEIRKELNEGVKLGNEKKILEEERKLLEEKKKLSIILNYKFNCTILVNYDIWEQAKIFANVNFNQKPVDRSLYFDIFGEIPEQGKNKKMSNLYVAHELGKYLNSSDMSPLKGFVKNFSSKEGFVSQAFFTQAILNLLGPRGAWNIVVEDFKKEEEERENLYKKLPKVFVSYFKVIKNVFYDYWPRSNRKEDATILVKTNSLGALIKLLGHINKMLILGLFPKKEKIDLLELDIDELETLFKDIFKVFNDETYEGKALKEKYFGKDSKYLGSGSGGLQSQLFKELAKELGISTQ